MMPHDREAMTAAIAVMRADQRDLIEDMLRGQSEQEVGLFAVGFCQVKNLHLKGWECPPCDTFDADPSDCYGYRPNEVALLRKMRALGISRYDPSPLVSIERVERERAA
jgi:hypothetical protein